MSDILLSAVLLTAMLGCIVGSLLIRATMVAGINS